MIERRRTPGFSANKSDFLSFSKAKYRSEAKSIKNFDSLQSARSNALQGNSHQ